MGSSFAYRVALVDDHRIFLVAFQKLLGNFPNLTITGCYTDAQQMLLDVPINTPEILFMDVQMPILNGINATKQLLSVCPDIKVIALTQCIDGLTASEMFRAGAFGYITKTQNEADLMTVFSSISRGEKYISAEIAMELSLYSINGHGEKRISERDKYTPRELKIIAWIVEGKTDKEIAQILGISPKTVDKDKRNIMKIMGVNKATQIVAMAFKLGLLP